MIPQKILILGGASSMGLATAQRAAQRGHTVIIAGRNQAKLDEALSRLGEGATAYQVDLQEESEVTAMLEELSPLDHVVVTVSSPGTASSIPDTRVEDAKEPFERFWMSYRVLHLANAYLSRTGSVTLISGSSSKTPIKGYGFWGTLHGSIEALARNAALELAPIRVNVVSPGGIGISPHNQLAEHYGTPEDIGTMIVALIENPAVTNAKIDVDGGERQGDWTPE